MQKSQRSLERSILDMMHVQNTNELNDPVIAEQSEIVYNNEHTLVIRIQQKPESVQVLKQPELIRVKIMVENEHGFAKYLKIELTSDTQISFNFIFECNDWEFKRIKANQNFFIQFREYPDFIVKSFEKLALHENYIASFTIFSETEGKLNLIRKSEFKDDTIMEFDFVRAPQEQIKKSIQYRYDLMRQEYKQYRARYQSVCETIKQKNPSLAIQIQKIHRK